MTKQSRNEEPVSEIAAAAEFILSLAEGLPHNDGRKRNPEAVWAARSLYQESPLDTVLRISFFRCILEM